MRSMAQGLKPSEDPKRRTQGLSGSTQGQEHLASCSPFSFKNSKSVELALTLGILVSTLTDTFLEGSAASSLKMAFPCPHKTQTKLW